MAKKHQAAAAISDNVTDLVLATAAPTSANTLQALTEFAVQLGVELSGTRDERADSAALHMNSSQRHMLAAGALLMSLKAECEHGEFLGLLESRGFVERTAQRAMQYAQFVVSRPVDERERLLEMPRSKVVALASADPEVINAILADERGAIDALSVRGLQDRIRELEAAHVDVSTQRDTAEAEAEGLRKQLRRAAGEREDHVPVVVADLRAEVSALHRKAELALGSFQGLGIEMVQLAGTEAGHEWADATLRLAVSALSAIHLKTTGLLKQFLKELPGEDATPSDRSRFTKHEIVESAKRYAELTQVHDYERTLREWEREQAKPRGKGRPSAKPEAPKGGAK